ncbi:MAG: 3TM-type holin [Alphaproteobacteria bacterium]
MLENILLKTGLPVLINIVKDSLINSDDKIAKSAGEALAKVTTAPDDKNISKSLAKISKHNGDKIKYINQSIVQEINSNDKYVRRMRPTFGYIMAVSWFIQMIVISISVFNDPATAGEIIRSYAELSMMWSVGLSVLGVYVYKRSNEKTNM